MAKAHINIGSNLGDSRALLEQAVAGIVSIDGTVSVRRSEIVVSEPWGYTSVNRYLNLGVEIETELSAEILFDRLMELQNQISDSPHRDCSGAYADRLIDIDLIFYDDLVCDSVTLTLPHARMHKREFVLKPLAQLSPQWIHPLLGRTALELLEDLTYGRAISADSIR